MLFYATCDNIYKDKNGNEYLAFVTDLGERVSVGLKYCTKIAEKGQRCILKVRAVHCETKSFLAYDCVSVICA